MHLARAFFTLASLATLATFAYAGFDLSLSNNIAVYWGQNSYDQGSGPLAQQRLGYYCSNTEFNVIQLAFLVTIANPELNFANAGNNCTLFAGTNLFYCPQLEEDIATCQTTYGKTILLSVGGATYTEGGFSDSTSAVNAANNLWAIFGPQVSGSTVNRPFGSSAIDGFDFDFESSVSNMVPFANQLRSLMDADTATSGKKWYLTAAPQCPYPDSADNAMLDGAVFFDAIWVQFYNNYCGLQSFVAGATTQNNFNFDTWDNWAKTVSLNPAVKVLLGVPGSPSAAGSGYETGSTLADVISYCQGFSNFGGVMTWDMSQIYANPGFLDGVYSDLAGGGTAPASSTMKSTMKSTTTMLPSSTFVTITTKTSATTTTTSAPTTTAPTGPGTVNQWGQCGGNGYTGSTVCVAPYTCVEISVWWSQCE